jgi:hypothetical protein
MKHARELREAWKTGRGLLRFGSSLARSAVKRRRALPGSTRQSSGSSVGGDRASWDTRNGPLSRRLGISGQQYDINRVTPAHRSAGRQQLLTVLLHISLLSLTFTNRADDLSSAAPDLTFAPYSTRRYTVGCFNDSIASLEEREGGDAGRPMDLPIFRPERKQGQLHMPNTCAN